MTPKERAAIQQAFETWWEREGQEFLFALNTTTDDDIKLVAEFAWKNGAYCAEQADGEQWSPNDMAYRPSSPSWETVDDAIAAEREACAKVCDSLAEYYKKNSVSDDYTDIGCEECAAAIRARK